MSVKRLEISNPEYTAKNTRLYTIHSSHINKRCDVTVYRSSHSSSTGSIQSPQKNTPIIVLMHGVYGSHWVWMHLGGVHKVYDALKERGMGEFILVMPSDGGYRDGSAYLPLENQHSQANYEKWIMDDVLNTVIEHTPGVSQGSNIYLSGLSMGGYGALRLGAKYSSKIRGISAHSAVTNIDDLLTFIDDDASYYQTKDQNEANVLYWMQHNLTTLPPIRLDCGKQDALYQSNITLTDAMKSLGVKFEFSANPGDHNWPYWHKYVADTFSFFNQIEYGAT